MKLILATDDQEQFTAVGELLHAHGIPVHEPAKHSDMPGFRVGANVRSLYVWLDHQFEDAVNLLRDPENYVVKHPVNWDEFDGVQNKVAEQMAKVADKGNELMINLLVGIAAIALLGFGAYRIYFTWNKSSQAQN
ncbi:MAG: hypothetical protein V4772_20535 [Pseudomonadota bacterium]